MGINLANRSVKSLYNGPECQDEIVSQKEQMSVQSFYVVVMETMENQPNLVYLKYYLPLTFDIFRIKGKIEHVLT